MRQDSFSNWESKKGTVFCDIKHLVRLYSHTAVGSQNTVHAFRLNIALRYVYFCYLQNEEQDVILNSGIASDLQLETIFFP